MGKIYYLSINEHIEQKVFDRLLLLVSSEKQKRIECFHCNIDKKLGLYADLLVRMIVCQKNNIKNDTINFDRDQDGKPYIKTCRDFQYNVSHTRNAVVVAMADCGVGVDIERIKPIDYKIADRFFSDNEQKYIKNQSDETDKRFYEIWTKKEAYIKYKGTGLPLLNSAIDVFDPVISNRIQTIEKDGYMISICSEWSNRQFEVIVLEECQVEALAFSILQ